MQKRSSRVAAFLATVSIVPLGLQACGEDPPPRPQVQAPVYASVEQCKISEANDALCDQAFAGARAQQAATAPNFSRKEQCEQQFGVGNCETQRTQNSDGSFSDVFFPAMAGFMLGNALSDLGDSAYERERRRNGYGPAYVPIYYGTNGAVYSGRSQVAQLPRGSSIPMNVVSNRAAGRQVAVPARSPRTLAVTPSRTGGLASVGTTSRGGFGATASGRGGGS